MSLLTLQKKAPISQFGLALPFFLGLVAIVLLTAPADARGRETFEINYHPNIVGTRISNELKSLADARNRAWIITIADINRTRGTDFRSFESWIAASPNDPLAREIEEALEVQKDWSHGTRGDGP